MDAHGGSIVGASGGQGKGSCFSITLPIVETGATVHSYVEPHQDLKSEHNVDLPPVDNVSSFHRILQWISQAWQGKVCSEISVTDTRSRDLLNTKTSGLGEIAPRNILNETGEQRDLSDLRSVLHSSRQSLYSDIHNTNTPNHMNCISIPNKLLPILEEKDDLFHLEIEKKKNENLMLWEQRCNVLIVDDVPMNRKMLKRMLVTRCKVIEEAENGEVACNMVRLSMKNGVKEHYDIILMDYQMPVMDGVTATRLIHQMGFKGRIIAVTGNALPEDTRAFLANGADIVLTKPLHMATLDNYIKSIKDDHSEF